ncbi:MAG: nucleotidyltransferase family protein [Flavobacteriaceae bacterium]|nr:nucleotidyltransferase family protein [Flavobacteriaceae bacterium]
MSKAPPKIAIIILAAGASSRMGKIKQLLPWKQTTLIGNAIEQALASKADDVFVVLGANYQLISKEIEQENITIIYNKNWTLGMGFSIRSTMDFFDKKHKKYDAVLIILVDQPLIDVIYFNMLIDKFINYNIIASKYKNRVGVPAIFSSIYFDALRKLNRDIGARDLILKHINDVKEIDAFDKIQDIDSISSYELLYQKYGK